MAAQTNQHLFAERAPWEPGHKPVTVASVDLYSPPLQFGNVVADNGNGDAAEVFHRPKTVMPAPAQQGLGALAMSPTTEALRRQQAQDPIHIQ